MRIPIIFSTNLGLTWWGLAQSHFDFNSKLKCNFDFQWTFFTTTALQFRIVQCQFMHLLANNDVKVLSAHLSWSPGINYFWVCSFMIQPVSIWRTKLKKHFKSHVRFPPFKVSFLADFGTCSRKIRVVAWQNLIKWQQCHRQHVIKCWSGFSLFSFGAVYRYATLYFNVQHESYLFSHTSSTSSLLRAGELGNLACQLVRVFAWWKRIQDDAMLPVSGQLSMPENLDYDVRGSFVFKSEKVFGDSCRCNIWRLLAWPPIGGVCWSRLSVEREKHS